MIKNGAERYLAIVLRYPGWEKVASDTSSTVRFKSSPVSGRPKIGILGAGNFARMTLLPALFSSGKVTPGVICSAKGVSAGQLGSKYDFDTATTDEDVIFEDDSIQATFVLTRHDLHGRHVLKSIQNGKHVFVEKPLCLNTAELRSIEEELANYKGDPPIVMVGFNRRFSPAAKLVRAHFSRVESPLTVTIRFNAGEIPADHWTQIEEIGGGRIIGEACHAIDLATFICDSEVIKVYAETVSIPNPDVITDDQCQIILRHANGSVSHVLYTSSGDKGFPKERIEVFGGGRVGVIDDFKRVELSSNGKRNTTSFKQQDKGHKSEVEEFVHAITETGINPIEWSNIVNATKASFLAVKSIREGIALEVE